jgi:hypothetical protein
MINNLPYGKRQKCGCFTIPGRAQKAENEMGKELEKMLSEGIVKNVYFTNYIIM